VLFSTIVFLNPIGMRLFFGAPLTARTFIAAAMGVAGVALLFLPELLQARGGGAVAYGVVFGLGSTVIASGGNLIAQRNQRAGIPTLSGNAWGMAYGALVAVVMASVQGLAWTFDPRPGYVFSLVYLALVGSVVAFGLYFRLLQVWGPGPAAYVSVVCPVFALALSTVLEGYRWRVGPAIGVVLNLQKDHKEMDEVAAMFVRFREHAREGFVAGEEDNLGPYRAGAAVFGFGPHATVRAERAILEPGGSRFEVEGVPFRLPSPGRHNAANALAAIAAARLTGVELAEMAPALAAYAGVARRFQIVGEAGGIEVVDDFAHNPAKLRAAIATAQARVSRVLAIYQPHGYGPTRFLRPDLVESFAEALRPEDRLWMLEVFYAGGTAQRDFSAADLAAEVAARGRTAAFAESREALVRRVAEEARPGDLVLVMGARDPSLSELARRLLEAVGQRSAAASRSLPGA
jgi:hypothetical protein